METEQCTNELQRQTAAQPVGRHLIRVLLIFLADLDFPCISTFSPPVVSADSRLKRKLKSTSWRINAMFNDGEGCWLVQPL